MLKYEVRGFVVDILIESLKDLVEDYDSRTTKSHFFLNKISSPGKRFKRTLLFFEMTF